MGNRMCVACIYILCTVRTVVQFRFVCGCYLRVEHEEGKSKYRVNFTHIYRSTKEKRKMGIKK